MLVVDAIAAEDVIRREVYKPGKSRQGSKRAFELLDVDFARPFGRRLTLRHIADRVTIQQDLGLVIAKKGFKPAGIFQAEYRPAAHRRRSAAGRHERQNGFGK